MKNIQPVYSLALPYEDEINYLILNHIEGFRFNDAAWYRYHILKNLLV